jgi:hypothetical protein
VSGAPVSGAEVVGRLAEMARLKTCLVADIWRRTAETFGDDWVEEVGDTVVRLFGPDEEAWEAALRGYQDFAVDAIRSQHAFEASGRYRSRSADELRERFYESERHMLGNYLPGLYLSHYLWPHHFRMLKFFRQEVLPRVGAPRLVYDVGVGTGLYSCEVLRARAGACGMAFDISPYSIAFARRVLGAYGVLERCRFVLGDILTAELPGEPAELVVSHELLEHLEDPLRLCAILHRLTSPGGFAYVTAAVNAAHSDHIYLFRSPAEVRALVGRAGWRVVAERAEYAEVEEGGSVTPCVVGLLCARD